MRFWQLSINRQAKEIQMSPTLDKLQPPQAIEVERAVLGCLLKDPNAVDRVVGILQTARAFYAPIHQIIYEAILNLYGASQPVDITTVVAHLLKIGLLDKVCGRVYLVELVEQVASTGNVGRYAEILKEKFTLRRIIEVSNEFISSCYSNNGTPVDQTLDRWQQVVFEIGQGLESEGFLPLCDDNDAWLRRVDQFQTGEMQKGRIRTGLSGLDRVIKGFAPGEMIVLAGETGSGKTQLALQIAHNIAFSQEKTAAILSLEMDAEELNARIQCFEALVDYSENVKEPGGLTDQQYNRLVQAAGRTQVQRIFVESSALVTPPMLLARTRKLKTQRDVRLLIVDYLQLIDSGGNEDTRERAVSGIARWMKTIAKELRITVLCLSQITPPMGLRESRAIGHHADKVMFVQHDPIRGSGILVAKQRSGPSGAFVKMSFVNGQWFEIDITRKEKAE